MIGCRLLKSMMLAGCLVIAPAGIYAQSTEPIPEIKIDGMDGWATLTDSDIFSVTVALEAGDVEGHEVELWLAAGTSKGNFSYVVGRGWVQGILPGWQGSLSDIEERGVWRDTAPFGVGEVWIGFAVDDYPDGLLDTTWFDLAAIDVQSTSGWEVAIGGAGHQRGNYLEQSIDSGYLITGENDDSTYKFKPYVLGTDSEGRVLETQTISDFQGWVRNTRPTTDGGLIILGSVEVDPIEPIREKFILQKRDDEGEITWTTYFGEGGDDAGAVRETMDGGYIVGGFLWIDDPIDIDLFLLKTNAEGEIVWEKTYGRPTPDYFSVVELTDDGGYILVSADGMSKDIYLVRTDAEGNMLWDSVVSTMERVAYIPAVQQTDDGGFILAGSTYPTTDLGDSDYEKADLYLAKLNSEGELFWSNTFGGDREDSANSVVQTVDGVYLAAGITVSYGAGNTDVYLVKTNSDGEELWSKAFGGPEDDYGNYLIEDTNGDYVITGTTNSFNETPEVYLIKVKTEK